jgi:aminopeptidase N
MSNENVKKAVEPVLLDLAKNDSKRLVKAFAISKLGDYKNPEYKSLFLGAVNDSSYSVSGSALEALNKIDSAAATAQAKRLAPLPSKGKLASQIKKLASPVNGNQLLSNFEAMPMGQEKFRLIEDVFDFLNETNSLDLFKRGVDDILKLEKDIPEAFREQATNELNRGLREIQKEKISKGQKDFADYIDGKLPKEDKKGF